MRILISACLAGVNCKYNGGNNRDEALLRLFQGHELIPVCPEVLGGLPVPRAPSEIRNGAVMTKDGRDVDAVFHLGAERFLEKAERIRPDLIVLQPRSPSCGVRRRYDGTFSGRLISGSGVTAKLLLDAGFRVIDADDLVLKDLIQTV